MHILMFSYDKTLVEGEQVGDTLLRHKCYADYLDKLDIVVPAPSRTRQTEIKVNEKLTVFPSHGSRALSWLRAYLKARKICRRSKVDIVVTQDPLLGAVGVLLRREFGCKLFINVFGTEMFSERWQKRDIAHRLYKFGIHWSLRNADLVRTETSRLKEFLMETFKIPSDKLVTIFVVPSPESIKSLVNAEGHEARKGLLENKYEQIVLFVGRLVDAKDLPNLLRAARLVINEYPKTLFAIIGEGPERGRLEKLCRELDIANNVRFLGATPFDEVTSYYAACDVFVLSSWSEGFGRVMMEAALAKRPVVATDVGGAREAIVDNETGYIVEIANPEQMADRIQRLLGNPQIARRMGLKGYRRALKLFGFEEKVKQLIAVWEMMLKTNEVKDNALAGH